MFIVTIIILLNIVIIVYNLALDIDKMAHTIRRACNAFRITCIKPADDIWIQHILLPMAPSSTSLTSHLRYTTSTDKTLGTIYCTIQWPYT